MKILKGQHVLYMNQPHATIVVNLWVFQYHVSNTRCCRKTKQEIKTQKIDPIQKHKTIITKTQNRNTKKKKKKKKRTLMM
jgi:hypothetical protein